MLNQEKMAEEERI